MKTAIEIMDLMIDSAPDGLLNKNPKPKLFVSFDIYQRLAKELNRNVRSYRKFKVVPVFHPKDFAVFSVKSDIFI